MPQIANTELSDTFDSWRNATNAVRHRMNAFAVNESKLYANTIAANVELISNTTATFSGNTNISGMVTLKYGANFKQADANTTMTLRGTLAADGANTNITGGSLLVTSNANFTQGIQLQSGHLQVYSDSGTPSKIDFYCETNNAHYARLQAPFHADYSGSPTATLPTGTGTLALLDDIGTYANTQLLIADRMQVANVNSDFLNRVSTGASQTVAGMVQFNANVIVNTFSTFNANTSHGDNVVGIFGTGSDLKIYHSGSESIIEEGTGTLLIKAHTLTVQNQAGTETLFSAVQDGEVSLYCNNYAKFVTTASGTTTTGRSSYNAANGAIQTSSLSGSQTPDLDAYTHFNWTLVGNLTLDNPTTLKAGQSGVFVFTHSGAARTVSLGSYFDAPSGTLALSTVSGYVDVVPYLVVAGDRILLGTSTKNLS